MSRKRKGAKPAFLMLPLGGGLAEGGFIDALTGDELKLWLLILAAVRWKDGGDGGVCYPRSLPYSTIAKRCRWSRSKVSRLVSSLVAKQAIVKEPDGASNGTIRPPTMYSIGPLHPWSKRLPSTDGGTGPSTNGSTGKPDPRLRLVPALVLRKEGDFAQRVRQVRAQIDATPRSAFPVPPSVRISISVPPPESEEGPAGVTNGNVPGPTKLPAEGGRTQ